MTGLSLTTVPKDLYYVERKLVADQAAEIERLRDVKRRSMAIADERAIEAVKARAENEKLRTALKQFLDAAPFLYYSEDMCAAIDNAKAILGDDQQKSATGAEMTNEQEEAAVFALAEQIGYGRTMQLSEELWRKKLAARGMEGGEHTTGPCATFMVPCPHPPMGRDENGHCDWCCGAGRITKRVFKAMCDEYDAASYEDLRKSGGIVDAP